MYTINVKKKINTDKYYCNDKNICTFAIVNINFLIS